MAAAVKWCSVKQSKWGACSTQCSANSLILLLNPLIFWEKILKLHLFQFSFFGFGVTIKKSLVLVHGVFLNLLILEVFMGPSRVSFSTIHSLVTIFVSLESLVSWFCLVSIQGSTITWGFLPYLFVALFHF